MNTCFGIHRDARAGTANCSTSVSVGFGIPTGENLYERLMEVERMQLPTSLRVVYLLHTKPVKADSVVLRTVDFVKFIFMSLMRG
jgi:hypothetical protein